MSDSSYSSTAPKPLHAAQAPRGLLNEKSAGVERRGGRVALAAASGCSVNRSRPAVVHARPRCLRPPGTRWRSPRPAGSARRRPGLQPVHHDQEFGHARSGRGRPRQLVEVHAARRRPGAGGSRGPAGSRRWRRGCVRADGGQRESRPGAARRPAPRRRRRGRLRRVAPDRRAAAPAVGGADAGPEQAEVVVHLGRGAHRGAARDGGVVLLDGHGGRDAPRAGPPAASASARGTAWRRWRATRCSGAGPRRRACRRRASSCRSRTGR